MRIFLDITKKCVFLPRTLHTIGAKQHDSVRVIEHEDVEWYSVGDILRSIQTGTDTMQAASRLRDANPTIVRKIFIFGNTHPAWFTTITGLRLLVSGSRKLKTRSNMLQLKEGGAR